MKEHDHQVLFFSWFRAKYPGVVAYAIPNGGARSPVEGRRLKDEGVLAGIPDICIALPHGRFSGLYLEMKAGNGKISPKQADVINRLRVSGYRVEIVRGYFEAKEVVECYMQ